jgi:hypothetical protein
LLLAVLALSVFATGKLAISDCGLVLHFVAEDQAAALLEWGIGCFSTARFLSQTC